MRKPKIDWQYDAPELLRPFAQQRLSAKAMATRDQRLAAALCHLSILLNTVTFIGGLAVCAFFYLLARQRVRFVEEQASKAFVFQSIVWGLMLAGWLFYRMLPDWLGGIIFTPLGALVWFCAIVWALWRAARCL